MTYLYNTKHIKYFLAIVVIVLCFIGFDITVYAQGVNTNTYQPLVGIPGVDNAVTNFGTYINQLYFLAISLAALLAVIKIIIAGVKYMLTDLGSSKADAKSDIWGALLGLLLIISAFLILTTVNPNLARLDALSGAPALRPATNAQSQNPSTAPIQNGRREQVPTQLNSSGDQFWTGSINPDGTIAPIAPADLQAAQRVCSAPSGSRPAGRMSYSVRICEPDPDAPRGPEICRQETRSTINATDGVTRVTQASCQR